MFMFFVAANGLHGCGVGGVPPPEGGVGGGGVGGVESGAKTTPQRSHFWRRLESSGSLR